VREKYLKLDVNRIQTHLDSQNGTAFSHSTHTFYSYIKAVPPGHAVSIDQSGVKVEKLTLFSPSKWDGLKGTTDISEAFFTLFKQSIERCARATDSPVSSHLSGGLDSSSVSAMVKFTQPEQALHTVHNRSKFADSDESRYAIAVAKKIGSVHHEVYQSENDFELINLLTSVHGQPTAVKMPPTLITSMLIYAKDLGSKILLTGSGGDSVVGSGFEIFHHAFETQNWALLEDILTKRAPYFSYASTYKGWDSFSTDKKLYFVKQFYYYNRIVRQKQKGLSRLFKTYFELTRNVDLSHWYFVKRASESLLTRGRKPNVTGTHTLASNELLEAADYAERSTFNYPASLANGLDSKTVDLFRDVFNPVVLSSSEGFFDLGNHIGISTRSPLQDKGLMELCMSIPDAIKFGNGLGREHFRNAMRDLLPESVVNRPGKATLTSAYGQEITLRLWNQAEEGIMASNDIWSFVDKKKFLNEVSILKSEKIPYTQKTRTWHHITRVTTLYSWLEWMKRSGYPLSF
jgi:asparagine synthase (glutamine-hydrolysing)